MNERERLLNKLNGTTTDRVPVICPGGMMNMITKEIMDLSNIYLPQAHHNSRMMAELAQSVTKNGIFENIGVPFCMTVESEMFGCPIDFGSDIFEPHIKAYILKSVDEYNKLTHWDFKNGRAKVVLDAIKILKENNPDSPVIGNLTGPVSVASSLMEPTVYYKELRRKNEIAHNYMDFVTKDLIDFALGMVDMGADVITIADPSGTGEILGPKLFKEFCVTYLNKIIDVLQKKNIKTIVHICGQMKSVYKEVNEVRADALSFDSIVPIKVAKQELPGRTIMGNISTLTLEFGNEEQIKKMSEVCIKSGSDILSPACGLGMRTSIKNIKAMKTEN